jgi:hypothetical protein
VVSLTLLFALGCNDSPELYDFDGDGVLDAEDCAPQDPEVYPGAADSWGNEVDEDCDHCTNTLAGLVPGDGIDTDCDGYAYNGPGDDWDCDDTEATSYPGATDSVGDGIDNNCDGVDGVDADGDGMDDLLIGAPFTDEGGSDAGKTYLILSPY